MNQGHLGGHFTGQHCHEFIGGQRKDGPLHRGSKPQDGRNGGSTMSDTLQVPSPQETVAKMTVGDTNKGAFLGFAEKDR